MELDYADIIGRLGEPEWWDSSGCPRYLPFKPEHTTVYGDQVALWLMACQDCGKRFKVSVVGSAVSLGITQASVLNPRLSPGRDPPIHDCPGAGNVMGMDAVRRLGYWEKDGFEWVRRRGLSPNMKRHLRIQKRATNKGWEAGYKAWSQELKRAWAKYFPGSETKEERKDEADFLQGGRDDAVREAGPGGRGPAGG